jgi:hypothetical protein
MSIGSKYAYEFIEARSPRTAIKSRLRIARLWLFQALLHLTQHLEEAVGIRECSSGQWSSPAVTGNALQVARVDGRLPEEFRARAPGSGYSL